MEVLVANFFKELALLQKMHSGELRHDLSAYFLVTIKDQKLRLTWIKDPGEAIREQVNAKAAEL